MFPREATDQGVLLPGKCWGETAAPVRWKSQPCIQPVTEQHPLQWGASPALPQGDLYQAPANSTQDWAKAAKAVIVPFASYLNTRAYTRVQQDPAQLFLALVSADPASTSKHPQQPVGMIGVDTGKDLCRSPKTYEPLMVSRPWTQSTRSKQRN